MDYQFLGHCTCGGIVQRILEIKNFPNRAYEMFMRLLMKRCCCRHRDTRGRKGQNFKPSSDVISCKPFTYLLIAEQVESMVNVKVDRVRVDRVRVRVRASVKVRVREG